ncbi:MAG: hypothetical protein ABI162_09350 [Luteolibacter sp.]
MDLLGDGPRIVPSAPRKPFWLIPNLLSLDAPLVAVAWLYIFAKTWRVDYHPWEAYVSLALVVWVIYVADRLLDSSMNTGGGGTLEARHEFHRRYQKLFLIGAGIAGLAALILVVSYMSYAIYHYVLIGGVVVAGFFGLSMLSVQEGNEVPHTKNILAGAGFAFGTAMMAHVYLPGRGLYDMIASREFICFAVLCTLNISAIDLWEHASRAADLEIKATDELALTLPLTLLGGASLIFALSDREMATRPFFYAVLTGSALLYILNRTRSRFSTDALRVLADVALLLPFLVFLASFKDAG